MDNLARYATRLGGPIELDAVKFPVLVSLRGSRSGTPRMKDDKPKLNPQGQPTYSVDADVIGFGYDDEIETLRGVFVNTATPVQEKFSVVERTFLRAEGKVWVLPYVDPASKRISYSISVERLVPVKMTQEPLEK